MSIAFITNKKNNNDGYATYGWIILICRIIQPYGVFNQRATPNMA